VSTPVVAVVGRPNVGKSTLFNRIVGERDAIVDDMPGVTRDRHSAEGEWNGRRFTLVDTGGLVPRAQEALAKQINAQIEAAIEQADACLLVTDGRDGVTPIDREVAGVLRRSGRPVVLVVNKSDNLAMAERQAGEFWELGLGEPHPVSALNGMGTGDLLDALVDVLTHETAEDEERDEITVAVVGKPNVGKSSFLNRLLGEERFIVSPVAGTTRDAIDTVLEWEGRRFRLVDTAGIRRHSRIDTGLEFYTYLRAVRSVERAQVAIVLLDATEPLSRQDLRILGLVEERRRGIVVAINKWDAVEEKETATAAAYERTFQEQAKRLAWAPVVTMSAKTGQRVRRALETAARVWEEWHRKIPTPELNRVLHRATKRVQPPQSKGRGGRRIVRVLYGHQVETGPPLILFYSNHPEAVPEHYRRYLEHVVRDAFGFEGVPLRIFFRHADRKSRAKAGS